LHDLVKDLRHVSLTMCAHRSTDNGDPLGPSQQRASGGAAAQQAGATPRGNEGVLCDDDDDMEDVFAAVDEGMFAQFKLPAQ